MRRAAIVSPLRTPVGRFLGGLAALKAEQLAALVIQTVVARSFIDPAAIDDVVFAQSYANSEAPCIGRWAALAANLPIGVPGFQVDRRCGGGLQAVVTAAMMVQTGAADVVFAGGVESMSNIEYYTTDMRGGARAGNVQLYDRLDRGRERSQPVERFGVISGMIETAENLAADYRISREAADRYAARSHQRAAAAWSAGLFDAEIIPVSVPQRKGPDLLFGRDEGIRADTTAESLGKLAPLRAGGSVTAGNSSQQNDAAAGCLVVAEDRLAALGAGTDRFSRRLGGGRLRSGAHGDRAGAGSGKTLCADRCQLEPGGSGRAERGVCHPGACRSARLALRERGYPQRERLRHFARPSHRRHRRADHDDNVARIAPVAAGAMRWNRCASAVARVWPRCSSGPDGARARGIPAGGERSTCRAPPANRWR